MRFQFGENTAHVLVEALDHGSIDRVVLAFSGFFSFVFGHQLRFSAQRRVDGVGRIIDKERAIFVAANEADRLIALSVGQVLARFARRQGRNALCVSVFVRVEVGRRLTEIATPDVDGEALFVGVMRFQAQMPFTDESCEVALFFQVLGSGFFR